MKRVYVNEPVCMGCHLCEVYCQLKHSQSKDIVKAFKRGDSRPVARLKIEERKPVFFSLRCQHCDEPPCVYACLTGALSKNPQTGVVTVDENKCIGCWTCALVCPFGAVVPDKKQHRMVKCDLCTDEEVPVGVANCPNEALVYAEVKQGPALKA